MKMLRANNVKEIIGTVRFSSLFFLSFNSLFAVVASDGCLVIEYACLDTSQAKYVLFFPLLLMLLLLPPGILSIEWDWRAAAYEIRVYSCQGCYVEVSDIVKVPKVISEYRNSYSPRSR